MVRGVKIAGIAGGFRILRNFKVLDELLWIFFFINNHDIATFGLTSEFGFIQGWDYKSLSRLPKIILLTKSLYKRVRV